MRGYDPDWREVLGANIQWPKRMTERWLRNLSDTDLLIVRDVLREESSQIQDNASADRWQRAYNECIRRDLLGPDWSRI